MITTPCKAVLVYKSDVYVSYERNRQVVTVLSEARTSNKGWGNLYHVQGEDGWRGEAFEDELTPVEDGKQ